jgi:hypothetical protein
MNLVKVSEELPIENMIKLSVTREHEIARLIDDALDTSQFLHHLIHAEAYISGSICV